MDILVCTIEDKQIGIEINKINSVVLAVQTTKLPNAPHYLFGAINVHGSIVPVLNMRAILGDEPKELSVNDQFILCNVHQKQVALWVNQVKFIKQVNTEEFIPADQILPDLIALQYVLKENGNIILIYDLEQLIPSNALSLASGTL